MDVLGPRLAAQEPAGVNEGLRGQRRRQSSVEFAHIEAANYWLRVVVDPMTEDLARAAVAAVEADWSAILRIAIETGQGWAWSCSSTARRWGNHRLVCGSSPSCGHRLRASVWPRPGTRASDAHPCCSRRLTIQLPRWFAPRPGWLRAAAVGRPADGGYLSLTPRAEVDGIDVLRPFLRPQFASVLQASDDPLADLARARARLARQVFDPEDGGAGMTDPGGTHAHASNA